MRPSHASFSAPKEGVGNAGCPVHPQPRVRSGSAECTRVFTAVAPEITRHPRTQWFYGLCRALPGDRAFLSPSLAKIASRKLDAGVEARTTRFCRPQTKRS